MASSPVLGGVRAPSDLEQAMNALIDVWCGRRCLGALRLILPVWPLVSPLTDSWGELLRAVRQVELLPKGTLTQDEVERLRDIRLFVEHVVYDR